MPATLIFFISTEFLIEIDIEKVKAGLRLVNKYVIMPAFELSKNIQPLMLS